jgi:hypothetical protein
MCFFDPMFRNQLHRNVVDGDWDVLCAAQPLPQFPNQAQLVEDAEWIVKRVQEDLPTSRRAAGKPGTPHSARLQSPKPVVQSTSNPPPEPDEAGVFVIDDLEGDGQESPRPTPQALQPIQSPHTAASEPEVGDDILSVDAVVLLLSRYCHSRGMSVYVRDVAHILAPFLCLRLSANATYAILYRFAATLLPRVHNWAALSGTNAGAALLSAADDRQYALLERAVRVLDGPLAEHLDEVYASWAAPAPIDIKLRGKSLVGNTPDTTLPLSATGSIPPSWVGLCFAGQLAPSVLLRLWTVLILHQPNLAEVTEAFWQQQSALAADSDPVDSERLRFSVMSCAVLAVLSARSRLLAIHSASQPPVSPSASGEFASSRGYDFVGVTLSSVPGALFPPSFSIRDVILSGVFDWPATIRGPSLPYAVFDAEVDCVYRFGDRYTTVVTLSKRMRKHFAALAPTPHPHEDNKAKSVLSALKTKLAPPLQPPSLDRVPKSASGCAALFACRLIARTWRQCSHNDLSLMDCDSRASVEESSTISSAPSDADSGTKPGSNWLSKAGNLLSKPHKPNAFTSSHYVESERAAVSQLSSSAVPVIDVPASGVVAVKAVPTSLPASSHPSPAAHPPTNAEAPSVPSPSLFSKLTSGFPKGLASRLSFPGDSKKVEASEVSHPPQPPEERRSSLFSGFGKALKSKVASVTASKPVEPPPPPQQHATDVTSPPKDFFGIGDDDESNSPKHSLRASAVESLHLAGIPKGSEWNFGQWTDQAAVRNHVACLSI